MAGKKTTLAAIAREAHVGVATVDRVINQRAPVRPETERKVIAAAQKLGLRWRNPTGCLKPPDSLPCASKWVLSC